MMKVADAARKIQKLIKGDTMDTPNSWAKATVKNDWGSVISNVELHHRYDTKHFDDKSWASLSDREQGDTFNVGYWTGFGRTGYDYWLIKFEADGKIWTCKDNFYCFLTDDDIGGTVICRVYKKGDAGKMDVICPESSNATVSLSSQGQATVPKPATAKPPITICDGTATPDCVERAPMASFEEALKKGAEELRREVGLDNNNKEIEIGMGFCNSMTTDGRFDKTFWEIPAIGQQACDSDNNCSAATGFLVPKNKSDPYTAFGKLIESVKRSLQNKTATIWECDCFGYVVLNRVYAYYMTLTKKQFNNKFSKIAFIETNFGPGPDVLSISSRSHMWQDFERGFETKTRNGTPFVREEDTLVLNPADNSSEQYNFTYVTGKKMDDLVDEAPIGSHVRWTNTDAIVKCRIPQNRSMAFCAYQAENTTKLDRNVYSAHPFGITSKEVIENNMAEAVFRDLKMKVSEQEKRKYIEKNIYISLLMVPKGAGFFEKYYKKTVK
jgi:hypothetical protein